MLTSQFKRKNDVKKLNTKIKATLVACAMVCSGSVFAVDYCTYGYKHNYSTPTKEQVENIRIALNFNTIGKPEWKKSIEDATSFLNSKFQEMGVKINYTFVSIEEDYDMDIVTRRGSRNADLNSSNAAAKAGTSNGVGDRIMINSDFEATDFTINQRRAIIMHELLHTLGVLHTNESIGVLLYGTNQLPMCDPDTWGRSLMEGIHDYRTNGNARLTPNAVDLYMIKKLYK